MPRLTGTAGTNVRTAMEAFNLQPPANGNGSCRRAVLGGEQDTPAEQR
jgi:hypothetical protein